MFEIYYFEPGLKIQDLGPALEIQVLEPELETQFSDQR